MTGKQKIFSSNRQGSIVVQMIGQMRPVHIKMTLYTDKLVAAGKKGKVSGKNSFSLFISLAPSPSMCIYIPCLITIFWRRPLVAGSAGRTAPGHGRP